MKGQLTLADGETATPIPTCLNHYLEISHSIRII